MNSNSKKARQQQCWYIIISATLLISLFYVKRTIEHNNNILKQTSIVIENDVDRIYSRNRIVNRLQTDYRPDILERFENAVKLELEASHPDLVSLARDMMDAPSTHLTKYSNNLIHTPQSQFVDSLLKKKRGFFVECGAMDGEKASNTIMLEYKKDWTGLLIEADPYLYTQLLGKNRHAWSINACLSGSQHAQWMTFAEDKGQRGMIVDKIDVKPKFLHGPERKTPCLPMETLLLALNRTRVDYFSLDIEGFEMEVLPYIANNDRLDINLWTIEYDKIGQEALTKFMENAGYEFKKKIDKSNMNIMVFTHDLVFLKRQK